MSDKIIQEICNEDLVLNQYDTNILEKNLSNLDMKIILRTQTLDINFIVNYILNEKYQILENKRESPQLPYGYPTSILLALVPWLWFSLVNPLLNKRA